VLAEVTEIIKSFGVNIISMAASHRPDDLPERTRGEVVLRLDTKNPEQLLKEIEKRGYKVVHVAHMAN
jgi:ACT domain-containing protein